MNKINRILVADSLSEAGMKILRADPNLLVDLKVGLSASQLVAIMGDYHALLVRSKPEITKEIIQHGTQLKLIGRAGIGVDNIDLSAAHEAGIPVINTPDGNSVTAAEHALFLMFALARHIPQAHASLSQGKWEKSKFMGTEIAGKTLGIVGLGNIGAIVAQKALAMGMKVAASDPVVSAAHADRLGVLLMPFNDLLASADFISIHAQLNTHTRRLFDEQAFNKVKPGMRLVNAARGGIVCEKSLLDALRSGKVGGAALDVFEIEPPVKDHPLLTHPLVIVTPHLGASTLEAQERVSVQLAEQTRDYFAGEPLRNIVKPATA